MKDIVVWWLRQSARLQQLINIKAKRRLSMAFGIESMNEGHSVTLISRVLELMLSITFSTDRYIRLKIRELVRNKELSADFMKCLTDSRGEPCMGYRLYIVLHIYGHMGTDAQPTQSQRVVRDIICRLSAGISSKAAGIKIGGNELGAGNLAEAYGIRMAKSFLCELVKRQCLWRFLKAPVPYILQKLTPQAAEYLKQLFGVIWPSTRLDDR